MVFNPSKITETKYTEISSLRGRLINEDEIFQWFSTAKDGYYSLPDDKNCPQLGGNASSCSLSGKLRSRAKQTGFIIKSKHDKSANSIVFELKKVNN